MLDVERMLAKSSKDNQPPGSRQSQESESGHPVIRTLYDHFEVNIYFDEYKIEIKKFCCIKLPSLTAILYDTLVIINKPNCLTYVIEIIKSVLCFIKYG